MTLSNLSRLKFAGFRLSGLVCLALIVGGSLSGGCGSPVSSAPINVNPSDLAKGQVTRANALLDDIQNTPPANRQLAASSVTTMSTLKAAAAADPATAKRISDLGIQLSSK